MPPILLAVWCLGIATKALAAYQIVRKGFFHRLPIFWAFILISVARSTALLCFIRQPRRYADIAGDSMPMMLLSEALAITSVFWLVTENFPRWRRPGTISLAVLALIGAATALLVRAAWTPNDWGYGWSPVWEWAILLQRHAMVAMAVVLLGMRLLVSIVRIIPVSPLAKRAADVLLIDVMLGFLISTITMHYLRTHRTLAFTLPVLAGAFNGLLWAFWLPAAKDIRELSRPRWRPDEEESIDWRACIQDFIGRLRQPFTAKP